MTKQAKRVQRTYLFLTLLSTLAASFIWGINTLFLLDAGLNNAEAFAANAFFTAGMVVFEVPTGVVADTWGRRTSYLLGAATLLLSTLLYLAMWRAEAPFWGWAIASASSAWDSPSSPAPRRHGWWMRWPTAVQGGARLSVGAGQIVGGAAMLSGRWRAASSPRRPTSGSPTSSRRRARFDPRRGVRLDEGPGSARRGSALATRFVMSSARRSTRAGGTRRCGG